MTERPLKVFVVAGEESGDRLGAALMRSLKERTAGRIEFAGVGGAGMAREGLASLFPLGELAIVGFAAIPARLSAILRRIRETAAAAVAQRPDIVVIIDSPEFTHRVAKRVRSAAPDIPIVDYVCPSVWAWRPGRARTMRPYVDHVLALLPFEPAAMARLGGPPTIFVGHPLTERVHELRPNADEARRREDEPPLLLVMPGSRDGELKHMLPVFAETLARLRGHTANLDVVVPTVAHLADEVRDAVSRWSVAPRVVVDPAEKNAAFRQARAALVKSGTGTLELALAGVPMVAAYKVSWIEGIVGRLLIKGQSVILANLVLGENVVPEFLQEDCTPDRLLGAILGILRPGTERNRQIAGFAGLDAIMGVGGAAPSEGAAEIVLSVGRRFYQSRGETVASTGGNA
ncbi:MAG TPA: lipid-A-disaccharide synthase [Pseudolabrys sp.]|nr:lipid-A-disaccharide synthase [Pseudolabrys sp.]